MRLTQAALEEAAPAKRTYKRKEKNPVLASLPACDENFTTWVKAVCAKLGAAQLVVVGVNSESQPVFAPVYSLEKCVVTEKGEEKFSTVFATRKILAADTREEGPKTFFTMTDDENKLVSPAAVGAINGVPTGNDFTANTFDSILLVDEDGQMEIVPMVKEGTTFRPENPTITADDSTIWKLDASVFPYQTGEVRIGVTMEKPARRTVAIEDLVEIADLPEL